MGRMFPRWSEALDWPLALIPGVDVNPVKRIGQRLPYLPDDVIKRVMRYVSVRDIANSQLVCKTWRSAINKYELELWEKRCDALELLSPDDANTVLRLAASNIPSRIESIRQNSPKWLWRSLMARFYRTYYFTLESLICQSCCLSDMDSLRPCCTEPCALKWVSLANCKWFMDSHFDINEFKQQNHENGGLDFIDVRKPGSFVSLSLGDIIDIDGIDEYDYPFGTEEGERRFVPRNDFENFCVSVLYAKFRSSIDTLIDRLRDL